VSVCIANYNGVDLLPDCLDSIRNQVDAPSFEIIAHDDASTDESLALLERQQDVRVIASPENVGFCAGNNRMAAVAEGKYLLLLNNDATLWPDGLATLHAEARADADAAILSLPQFDFESGELLDRGMLLDPLYNPVPNLDPRRKHVAMVMGACLWIDRDLWQRLGGFPEWMGSIGEDMYLCCVADSMGYRVSVTDRSGYRHHVGSSFGGGKVRHQRLQTTVRRRRLSERNKTCVMAACAPLPDLAIVLPVHLLALLMEGLLMSLLARRPSLFREVYWHAISAPIACFRPIVATRRRRVRNGTWRRRYYGRFVWVPRKLAMLLRYGVPTLRP